jgi:PAS domain S-box-containing protein
MLVVGILKDVKQKEQLEKMAKDIEEAYKAEKISKEKIDAIRVEDEALLSSIGDGVIASDEHGDIMFMNKAAEDMLGIKSEQAIGKPYDKVLIMENEKGEAITKDKDPVNAVLSSGKKMVTASASDGLNVIYYAKPDHTKFPVAVTVAPVVLDGKTIGAVDVFRDITIERQIDKSKSEFVSLASHQLRTPLTAIKWYSEILLQGKSGKLLPKQKKYLDEIYHGNERMIKLINIMLNISRFEAGRIKINPLPTDIKKLLLDIINEQKFDIKKKKQSVTLECQDNLDKMTIDPDLMRLIFQNLVSNAIKYTPDKGTITCKAEQKKDSNKVLFTIQDTGIGIPQNQHKRIFEKLFRADNAFPHDPEGNGLGLYAVKMAVEGMGGRIWFDSKQNEGTTFFVEMLGNKG